MGNGSEWEPERVTDKMTTPSDPNLTDTTDAQSESTAL